MLSAISLAEGTLDVDAFKRYGCDNALLSNQLPCPYFHGADSCYQEDGQLHGSIKCDVILISSASLLPLCMTNSNIFCFSHLLLYRLAIENLSAETAIYK